MQPTGEEWRVVLRDRTASARVMAGATTYEDVPIVTARAEEPEESVLGSIAHDAVLLKESATTAHVRVMGALRGEVPIYKERLLDASTGASEMVRVRVHEIRERPADAPAGNGGDRKGFLTRMFRSK